MAQDTLPTYHFLLVAPNLGPEWLFDAARAYWDRFQPTVISDLTLIPLIPPTLSIAVTVLARHDRAPQYGVELAQQAPHALFDPIVYDFIEDAQAALDRRAQLNQPFGVPLIPTATWTPAPTAIPLAPTSGPVIPPQGSGFITQTPTPPAPDETAAPPAVPLSPTPGPITGG